MMTLEELVTVKIYLTKLLESSDYIGYEKSYNRLPEDVKSSIAHVNLQSDIDAIKKIGVQFEEKIKKELQSIESQINSIVKDAYKEGYMPLLNINNEELKPYTIMRGPTAGSILTEINEDVIEIVKTIVASSSDWKFPSLEIGCGTGQMTTSMVAADPLYVTDMYKENLEVLKNKFNQIYQKRIRCYMNRGDFTKFEFLPQEQFQFILAWDVFNVYPQLELKETLSSCWSLLKPGGSILFSYSDCNYIENVKSFSIGMCSWLTEEIVNKILTDTGFEVMSFNHYDDKTHWVEARKPGELTTIKFHPSIGKISLG